MKIFLHLSLTFLLFFGALVPLQAQGGDSNGDFCSLFYLKSNKLDILPFQNDCFTHVTYHILDHRRLEYVGPINSHSDLFKPAPWGLTLELPPIEANGELKIISPEDPASEETIAPTGFAHLFLSKFEQLTGVATQKGKPNFRAESGNIRIREYNPSPEEGKFEFIAYVSCYVKEVVNGELSGPRINVRFSMLVREDYPQSEENEVKE